MVQQLSSVNHLHSMTLERLSTHSSVQFISLSITVFKVGVLLLSVYRTFYSEPPFACLPRRLEWNSSARGKSSHTFHCQGKCSALNKALHGESRFGKKRSVPHFDDGERKHSPIIRESNLLFSREQGRTLANKNKTVKQFRVRGRNRRTLVQCVSVCVLLGKCGGEKCSVGSFVLSDE